MKTNKNTFINRFLWRRQCLRECRKMTQFKLNEFYCNLLHNKNRSKFPQWQIQIATETAIKVNKEKNDKSK